MKIIDRWHSYITWRLQAWHEKTLYENRRESFSGSGAVTKRGNCKRNIIGQLAVSVTQGSRRAVLFKQRHA